MLTTLFECIFYLFSLFYFDRVTYILYAKISGTPEKTSVISHPHPPITVTCLQQSLSSVPRVALAERFDCLVSFLDHCRSFFGS